AQCGSALCNWPQIKINVLINFFSVLQFWKIYNADERPLCPSAASEQHRSRRVVGGRDAGEPVPFMASLQKNVTGLSKPFPFCGASMLTERHLVTAAHCLKNKTASMLSVNVGDYNLSATDDANNIVRNLLSFLQHENYIIPTYDNDIAVLTLIDPVPWESLTTVVLPPVNSDLAQDTTVCVMGWGRLQYEGAKPTTLQKLCMPSVNRTECQRPLTHQVHENMICAGGREGQDACVGDSGGPLMVQAGNYEAIVGVVSFGKKCALKDVYGVYTRVGRFVPWLYEHTRNATCKPTISAEADFPDIETTTKPALPEPVADNHI
ncbi:hypothetical protein V5799_024335, partial [Amblyomma americanum]